MLRLLGGLKRVIEHPVAHFAKFNNATIQNGVLSNLRNYSALNNAWSPITRIMGLPLLQQHEGVFKFGEQCRTITKFSKNKGKRKSSGAVHKRFYRLHWGAWIRTYAGRTRKLWKKSVNRKCRLKQHVFVNATQSRLLDTLVTNFWRKPRYWVDNIYEPYNTREEFWVTARKPHDPDQPQPKKTRFYYR